jgi:hypothetical protein
MSSNVLMIKTYDYFEIKLELKQTDNKVRTIIRNRDSIELFDNVNQAKILFKDCVGNEVSLITYEQAKELKSINNEMTNESILQEILQKYSGSSGNNDNYQLKMNVNLSFSKQAENNSTRGSLIGKYNSNMKRVRDKINEKENNFVKICELKDNGKENNKENIGNDAKQFIQSKDENPTIKTFLTPSQKKITPSKNTKRHLVKGKILFSSPKNVCSICLDGMKNRTTLNHCKHEFCKDCIENWSKMTNLCPLCKVEFSRITFFAGHHKKVKKIEKRSLHLDEEEAEELDCMEACIVCGRDDDEPLLLVCDECNYYVCHTYCDNLKGIPEGEWKCPDCRHTDFLRRVRMNILNNEEDEQDEEGYNSDDSFKTKKSKTNSINNSNSRYNLRSRNNSEFRNNLRGTSRNGTVNLNLNLNLTLSNNFISPNVTRSERYNLRSRNRSQN